MRSWRCDFDLIGLDWIGIESRLLHVILRINIESSGLLALHDIPLVRIALYYTRIKTSEKNTRKEMRIFKFWHCKLQFSSHEISNWKIAIRYFNHNLAEIYSRSESLSGERDRKGDRNGDWCFISSNQIWKSAYKNVHMTWVIHLFCFSLSCLGLVCLTLRCLVLHYPANSIHNFCFYWSFDLFTLPINNNNNSFNKCRSSVEDWQLNKFMECAFGRSARQNIQMALVVPLVK